MNLASFHINNLKQATLQLCESFFLKVTQAHGSSHQNPVPVLNRVQEVHHKPTSLPQFNIGEDVTHHPPQDVAVLLSERGILLSEVYPSPHLSSPPTTEADLHPLGLKTHQLWSLKVSS